MNTSFTEGAVLSIRHRSSGRLFYGLFELSATVLYETVICKGWVDAKAMEETYKPRVMAADRLDGSVIITFDDGRCGIFDSEVLYATLPQAKELFELTEPALDDRTEPERV